MFIATFSYSQGQCSNHISTYHGPTKTAELYDVLFNSDNDLIKNLSVATKQSLLTYVTFDGGLPRGMSGSDDNIRNLYGSADAEKIFSSIFSMAVTLCTYDTKPDIHDMSLDEYMHNFQGDPESWAAVSVGSMCTNCLIVPAECCRVDGPGCMDNYMMCANGISLHIY